MKRKLVFLPAAYSKEVVETINNYFDQGYEIEDILSADAGCYLLLVLKSGDYAYKFAKNPNMQDKKCDLIEEKKIEPEQRWFSSSTMDVKPN
jgi:hypothetical protein